MIPFDSPQVGIRFAEQATEFEKARAKIATEPEDALSSARRLADVALSEIAERLEVPLPHLRGDDNDHRTGGHLLLWINKRASKAFKVKRDHGYERNEQGLTALRALPSDLAIWANRGTHTFSASQDEARRIIDEIEAVLSAFDCPECRTQLGHRVCANGDYECQCGHLQWKAS